MSCRCQVCGEPVDCGDTVCPRCEGKVACKSAGHCAVGTTIKIIREAKPGLFVVQFPDGKYGLEWIPDDVVAKWVPHGD